MRDICRMRKRIFYLIFLSTVCLFRGEAIGYDSEIVAKVGVEIVTKLDLDVMGPRFMVGVPGELPQMKAISEDKKKVVEETINLTLLAMEAKKTELMNSPTLEAEIRFYVDAL
jgi:hypothetical protein